MRLKLKKLRGSGSYPLAKMSSSSIASFKPRGAKRVLTDILLELKTIARSEEGERAIQIKALRKEMKARYKNKKDRAGLLMRAAAVIEEYCDKLDENYEESSYDEMAFLDDEIERLTELVEDAEAWADIYEGKN